MLLLKAVETNRGIIGPGEWERRSWKIQTDGTYRLKTTYRPVDPADPTPPEVIDEGALYDEQLELLKDYATRPWHNEKAKAGESSWEFKLYDENEAVIRHREPGYIQGMDPFDRIAAMLLEELPEE